MPVEPASLEDLRIPDDVALFEDGSPFLLRDEGVGNERILVFGSAELIAHLSNTTLALSDGTFSVVPGITDQLYT